MKLFGRRKKRFSENSAVCIYGPPEMLMQRRFGKKDDDNAAEGIYGPPEMLQKRRLGIKDDDNVPEDIYGPPEMLGALDKDNISDTTEDAEVPPDEEEDDI